MNIKLSNINFFFFILMTGFCVYYYFIEEYKQSMYNGAIALFNYLAYTIYKQEETKKL